MYSKQPNRFSLRSKKATAIVALLAAILVCLAGAFIMRSSVTDTEHFAYATEEVPAERPNGTNNPAHLSNYSIVSIQGSRTHNCDTYFALGDAYIDMQGTYTSGYINPTTTTYYFKLGDNSGGKDNTTKTAPNVDGVNGCKVTGCKVTDYTYGSGSTSGLNASFIEIVDSAYGAWSSNPNMAIENVGYSSFDYKFWHFKKSSDNKSFDQKGFANKKDLTNAEKANIMTTDNLDAAPVKLIEGAPYEPGEYIMKLTLTIVWRGIMNNNSEVGLGTISAYAKFRVHQLEADFAWLNEGEPEEFEYNGQDQMRTVHAITNQPDPEKYGNYTYVYDYDIKTSYGNQTYTVATASYKLVDGVWGYVISPVEDTGNSSVVSGAKNIGNYRTLVTKIYYIEENEKKESKYITLSNVYEKYSCAYTIVPRNLEIKLKTLNLTKFTNNPQDPYQDPYYKDSTGNYIININYHNPIKLPTAGEPINYFDGILQGGTTTIREGSYDATNISITGGLAAEPFIATMAVKAANGFLYSINNDPPVTEAVPHTLVVNLAAATDSKFVSSNYNTTFVAGDGTPINIFLNVDEAVIEINTEFTIVSYSGDYDEQEHEAFAVFDEENSPCSFKDAITGLGDNEKDKIKVYYYYLTDTKFDNTAAEWNSILSAGKALLDVPRFENAGTYRVFVWIHVEGYTDLFCPETDVTINQATNEFVSEFNFANGKATILPSDKINDSTSINDADTAWVYGRYSEGHKYGYNETGDHAVTAPVSKLKKGSAYALTLWQYSGGQWVTVNTSVSGLNSISTTDQTALRNAIQTLFTNTRMNAGTYRLQITQSSNENFTNIDKSYIFKVDQKEVKLAVNPTTIVYGTSDDDAQKACSVTATGLVVPVLNGEPDTVDDLHINITYTITYDKNGTPKKYEAGYKNGSAGVTYTISVLDQDEMTFTGNYKVKGEITPATLTVERMTISVMIYPQENFYGLKNNEKPRALTYDIVSTNRPLALEDVFYLQTTAIEVYTTGSNSTFKEYLTSKYTQEQLSGTGYEFKTGETAAHLISLKFNPLPEGNNAPEDALYNNNYNIEYNSSVYYSIKSAVFNMRWGTLKTLNADGKVVDATSQVYTGRPYFYLPGIQGFEGLNFSVRYFLTSDYNAGHTSAEYEKLPIAAGRYTAVATLSDSSNFDTSSATTEFIITASSVTLTADGTHVTYGKDAPDLTFTVSYSSIGTITPVSGVTNTYSLNYTVYNSDAAFNGKDPDENILIDSTSANHSVLYAKLLEQLTYYSENNRNVVSLGTATLKAEDYTSATNYGDNKTISIEVTAEPTATGNVSFTKISGTLTVDKRDITVTFRTKPDNIGTTVGTDNIFSVYSGEDKTGELNTLFEKHPDYFIDGYSSLILAGSTKIWEIITLSFKTNEGTNAGSPKFVAVANSAYTTNYNITVTYKNGTGDNAYSEYLIKRKDVTVTFKEDQYPVTYGEALTLGSTVYYDITGLVEQELAVSIGAMLSLNAGGYEAWTTGVGTCTLSMTISSYAETTFSNYEIDVTATSTLNVEKREIGFTVNNPTYNGSAQAAVVTFTNVPAEHAPVAAQYSLAYAGTSYSNVALSTGAVPTLAGGYTVTMSFVKDSDAGKNFTLSAASVEYTISKQKVAPESWTSANINLQDISTTADNYINYNAAIMSYAITLDNVPYSDEKREGNQITVTVGSNSINKTYAIEFTLTDTDNYEWVNDSETARTKTFTVTDKTTTITLTVSGWTYGDAAVKPEYTPATGEEGGDVVWAFGAVSSSRSDYADLLAEVNTTLTTPVAGVALTEVANSVIQSYLNGLGAGLYALSCRYTVPANHPANGGAVGYAYALFKVDKKTIAIPTFEDDTTTYSSTYTAVEQTVKVNGILETGTPSINITGLIDVSTGVYNTGNQSLKATDAGEYVVVFTLKNPNNYVWSNESDTTSLTWTIEKATPTVTIGDLGASFAYAANNNYRSSITVTVEIGETTIGKDAYSVSYNYKNQAVANGVAEGATYNSSTAPVNVGEYVLTVTVAATNNWNVATQTQNFEITRYALDIQVDGTLTYGQPFAAAQLTTKYTSANNTDDTTKSAFLGTDNSTRALSGTPVYKLSIGSVGVPTTGNIAAGDDYSIVIVNTSLSSDNYALTFTAGTFTVAKKAIELTVNNINRYYLEKLNLPTKIAVDDNPFTVPSGTFATGDDVSVLTNVEWTLTAGDRNYTYNPDEDPTSDYVANTYTLAATHAETDNYKITIKPGLLNIQKLPINITINANGKVFDGEPVNVTYTATVDGVTTSVSNETLAAYYSAENSPVKVYYGTETNITAPTKKGTYSVTVDFGSNFTPNKLTTQFVISELVLSVSGINNIDSQTYSGSKLIPDITHGTILSTDDDTTNNNYAWNTYVSVTYDNVALSQSSLVNAGTYNIAYKIVDSYKDSVIWSSREESVIKVFEITKLALDTSKIKGVTGCSKVYNGDAVSTNVTFTDEEYNGYLTYENVSGVSAAGTYTVTFTINDTANVCWEGISGDTYSQSFTISKLKVNVAIKNVTSDGEKIDVLDVTWASGLNLTHNLSVTYAEGNNAGTEVVLASVSKPDPVYSGTTFSGTTYSATETAPTEAGVYTISYTLSDNCEVIDGELSKKFTINKLTIKIDDITLANKTYTGSNLQPEPAYKEGSTAAANSSVIVCNPNGVSYINAGTYSVTFRIKDDVFNNIGWDGSIAKDSTKEYVIDRAIFETGKIAIEAQDFVDNDTVLTAEIKYDGNVLSTTFFDISGDKHNAKGTYSVSMAVKPAHIGNVYWKTGDDLKNTYSHNFVINGKTIDVKDTKFKGDKNSDVYNGSEFALANILVGLPEGRGTTYTVNSSTIIDKGEYPITFAIADKYTNGYTFVNGSGDLGTSFTMTFTVNQLDVKVAYGFDKDHTGIYTATYDGNAHKLLPFFTYSGGTTAITDETLLTELKAHLEYQDAATFVTVNSTEQYINVNSFRLVLNLTNNFNLTEGNSSCGFAIEKLLLLAGKNITVDELTFNNKFLAANIKYGGEPVTTIESNSGTVNLTGELKYCSVQLDGANVIIKNSGTYTLKFVIADEHKNNVGWSASNSTTEHTVIFTVNKLEATIGFTSNNIDSGSSEAKFEGTYSVNKPFNVTYTASSAIANFDFSGLIAVKYVKVADGSEVVDVNGQPVMPTDAGTYEIVLTPDANLLCANATYTKRFTISPLRIQNVTVNNVDYTGVAQCAKITIKDSKGNESSIYYWGGENLTSDEEGNTAFTTDSYSVTSTEDSFTAAKVYQITLTRLGGNNVVWPNDLTVIERNFEIRKIKLSEGQIAVNNKAYSVDGYELFVTDDNSKKVYNKDIISLGDDIAKYYSSDFFEIKSVDSTTLFKNAGTYTIRFEIKERHRGSVEWATNAYLTYTEKEFVISELPAIETEFIDIEDVTYNLGAVINPAILIKEKSSDSNTTLTFTENTANGTFEYVHQYYTISYSNNIKDKGTYEVVYRIKEAYYNGISFKKNGGNVKQIVKTFNVVPKEITVSYPNGVFTESSGKLTAEYNGTAQFITPIIDNQGTVYDGITFRYENTLSNQIVANTSIIGVGSYKVTVVLNANFKFADGAEQYKEFSIYKLLLDGSDDNAGIVALISGGSYTDEFKYSGTGFNFRFKFGNEYIDLAYVSGKGVTGNYAVTLSGTAQQLTYFTVTVSVNAAELDGEYKIKNAGTYTAIVTIANPENIGWQDVDGSMIVKTFVIDRLDLNADDITILSTPTYGVEDSDKKLVEYTVFEEGGHYNIVTSLGNIGAKYITITCPDKVIQNAKTYILTFTINNFNEGNVYWVGETSAKITKEFVIAPVEVDVTVSAPTRVFGDTTSSCSISVVNKATNQPLNNVKDSATVEYTDALSGDKLSKEPTSAGTYNVTYKLDSNYIVSDSNDLKAQFIIRKLELDEDDVLAIQLTYTEENKVAKPLTPVPQYRANSNIAKLIADDSAAIVVTAKNAVTDAGSYGISYKISDYANICWKNTNGAEYSTEFTVEKANNNYTVSGFVVDWGYGEKHVPTITLAFEDIYYLSYYPVKEDGSLDVPERTVPTNYGTYRIYITTTGTPNVNAIVADPTKNVGYVGQFTITTYKVSVPEKTKTDVYTGDTRTWATTIDANLCTLVCTDPSAVISFTINSEGELVCSAVNAGTYLINVNFIDPVNYEWRGDVTSVQLRWTISPAENKLNIVKSVDGVVDGTIFYGSNYSVSANSIDGTTPAITYAAVGEAFDEDKADLLEWSQVKPTLPGRYVIKAESKGTNNYLAGVEYKAFEINKATLTVTPAGSMTYGQMFSEGTFSYSVTGYIANEDGSVLSGKAVYGIKDTDTAEAHLTVGEYVLTVKGLSAANYIVEYAEGKLTVAKKAISVKVNDVTTQYSLTYTFTSKLDADSELAAWDEETGISVLQITYITDAEADGNGFVPAGSYAIRANGYTNKNYTVTFVEGILKVNPVELSFDITVTNGIYEDRAATAVISKIMKSDGKELEEGKLLNLIKSAVSLTYSGNTNSGRLIEKSINMPTEAGSYTANVVTRDTKNFTLAALSSSAQFSIEKKTIDETTITIDSKQYTGSTITVPTPIDTLYTSYYTVEVPSNVVDARDYSVVLRLLDSYNVQWKTVSGATCQIIFTVTPKPNAELPETPGSPVKPELTISDWTFGEYSTSLNAPSIGVEYAAGMYFEYSDAEDGVYTTKIPSDSAVGTYWVRAVVPASQNYQAYTSAAVSFRIEPKIIAEPQLNIITSGDDQNNVYTGEELTMRIAYNTALMRIITDEGITVRPSADGVRVSVLNANADGYKITFQLLNSNYVWEDNGHEDVVLVWKVARKIIVKPTAASKDTYFVNGTTHKYSPVGFDAETMVIEGNTGAEGGKYGAIVSIKDTVNYYWEDGTQGDVTFSWRVIGRGVIFGIVFGSLALIALAVGAVLVVRVVRHNNTRKLINELAAQGASEADDAAAARAGAGESAAAQTPKETKPKKTTKKEPAAEADKAEKPEKPAKAEKAEKPSKAKSETEKSSAAETKSSTKSKSTKTTKSDGDKGGAK